MVPDVLTPFVRSTRLSSIESQPKKVFVVVVIVVVVLAVVFVVVGLVVVVISFGH